MRAIDYVTQGFGAQIQTAQVSQEGRLLERAGLDRTFDSALRATLNQRGVAGVDQAISFFSKYDQSLQSLMQMMYQNNWAFGGLRGKQAVYEAVRRTFNSISAQVGTNPLINAFTKAALSQINQSQAEEYKFLLGFIGQYLTDSLRRLRASL